MIKLVTQLRNGIAFCQLTRKALMSLE